MTAPTHDERRAELARLRREMAALMRRIQEVTGQQGEVIDRCNTEAELEADPDYEALSQEKAALGERYHALAARADELVEVLGD